MALQGYADQPCPQWDMNPPPQYMSWPRITPDSRHLNPLGHHDQDFNKPSALGSQNTGWAIPDKFSHQLNQCDHKSSTLVHLDTKVWDIIRIYTVIIGITF